MTVCEKLSVLEQVARLLNQKGVRWAVGASLLLYLKGIVATFNDIDIMIAEEDAPAVEELLAGCGTLLRRRPNAQYRTRVFLEAVVSGVEFDVIAGFTIVDGNKAHYFPLAESDIAETVLLGGVPVPLQSVDAWKTYYRLMGRTEKVMLIEAYTQGT